MLHRDKCCFAAELDCSGFRNSRTGSVLKKIDGSCAGGKVIENPSISPNQHEDGPNDDNEVLETGKSKGWKRMVDRPGNSAFRSSEQRVAVLLNHSPQKTVNFSNTIRSIESR